MPSVSPKEHRFMEAVDHDPAFAKKAGVPASVGKDFVAADKGKMPIVKSVGMIKPKGK